MVKRYLKNLTPYKVAFNGHMFAPNETRVVPGEWGGAETSDAQARLFVEVDSAGQPVRVDDGPPQEAEPLTPMDDGGEDEGQSQTVDDVMEVMESMGPKRARRPRAGR